MTQMFYIASLAPRQWMPYERGSTNARLNLAEEKTIKDLITMHVSSQSVLALTTSRHLDFVEDNLP